MGSACTSLSVDDDPGVRQALDAALADRHTVCAAADAVASLVALAAYYPDLIRFDDCLRDRRGTALLQAVKRYLPANPVILMTRFGSEDVRG